VPVCFGAILAWQVVIWLQWPALIDQMTENAERLMRLMPRLHLLTFGGVALTVGVYEELVFRGFLMPRLRRATGSWTAAVVISTILFTIPHWIDQTTVALVPVAILSVVFSLLTIWRKSLVPAIMGHFLFDWAQFVALAVTAGDAWE
jgi:membrane protease YdiL (CAAX protease family)